MTSAATSILECRNVSRNYGALAAVDGIDLKIGAGEAVGIGGPNGAGKTTTFYMTVGFIKPNEGRVYLDEEDITDLPMYKRARKGISYLPQEASIFRKLSVENNIRAVLEMTNLSKSEQKDRQLLITG